MGLLKNLYTRTNWVDNKTLVNAERLNNLERGVAGLYNASLCASDFIEGQGVKIETTDEGKVKISALMPVEIIQEEQEEYDPGKLYFFIGLSGKIEKIIIGGVSYGLGL